jgi:hypothetical protein
MYGESFLLTDWLDNRLFRWKWNAAMPVACIDVIVASATNTCPIVPRGLRRGVLELDNAIMMALGSGIAHRGAGVPGAAVITRLSVKGRSRCHTVLDWP